MREAILGKFTKNATICKRPDAIPMKSIRPIIVYSLLIVNLTTWLLMETTGGSQDFDNLRRFGAIRFQDINDGEYWRLFTAMFIHIGAAHLAVNGISLLIMGGIVERVFGHRRFGAIYTLSGLGGSSFSYSMIDSGRVVGAGASGAIFGCLGALAGYFLFRKNVLGPMGRQNLNAVMMLAVINFAFGFVIPGIDNWAHLGGFLIGGLVGVGLLPHISYGSPINRPLTKRTSVETKVSDVLRGSITSVLAAILISMALYIGNNRTF